MVGDNDLQPACPGVSHLLHGPNATVHRDDQAHALISQLVQCFNMETITLIHSMGDIRTHVCTQGA